LPGAARLGLDPALTWLTAIDHWFPLQRCAPIVGSRKFYVRIASSLFDNYQTQAFPLRGPAQVFLFTTLPATVLLFAAPRIRGLLPQTGFTRMARAIANKKKLQQNQTSNKKTIV
jgi:hypothetical protein